LSPLGGAWIFSITEAGRWSSFRCLRQQAIQSRPQGRVAGGELDLLAASVCGSAEKNPCRFAGGFRGLNFAGKGTQEKPAARTSAKSSRSGKAKFRA